MIVFDFSRKKLVKRFVMIVDVVDDKARARRTMVMDTVNKKMFRGERINEIASSSSSLTRPFIRELSPTMTQRWECLEIHGFPFKLRLQSRPRQSKWQGQLNPNLSASFPTMLIID